MMDAPAHALSLAKRCAGVIAGRCEGVIAGRCEGVIAGRCEGVIAGRCGGIDALRGVSILAVVLLHLRDRLPVPTLPRWLGPVVFWNGYNGVIVFFSLSGFLIASTSLRRWGSLRQLQPLAFYRLRFARIAPCLLGLLAVLSALHGLRVPGFVIENTSLGRALFSALTFHLNWLEAKLGYLPANWDVLWSLSVEETFYLFFPLLCRRLGKGIVPVLLAFIVAGPFTRVALGNDEIWSDKSYLSCMDAISIGILAALVADKIRGKALLLAQIAGLALMLLVMGFRKQTAQLGLYRSGLDVTVLALGAALAAIAFQECQRPATWVSAPLRWFGRSSYEIYLTHLFVILACVAVKVPGAWLFAIALSGLVGGVLARSFSEPLNRALRGVRSSAARRPAAGAS
jgi:peptidoglycan/LPS O-acetylase OafA/YrhL